MTGLESLYAQKQQHPKQAPKISIKTCSVPDGAAERWGQLLKTDVFPRHVGPVVEGLSKLCCLIDADYRSEPTVGIEIYWSHHGPVLWNAAPQHLRS